MMPVPLLQAYLAMLPRLEAEESLVAAERIAVGTGSMTKDGRDQVIDAWRTAAQIRIIRRPRDRVTHGAQLASVGIGLHVAPKD